MKIIDFYVAANIGAQQFGGAQKLLRTLYASILYNSAA